MSYYRTISKSGINDSASSAVDAESLAGALGG